MITLDDAKHRLRELFDREYALCTGSDMEQDFMVFFGKISSQSRFMLIGHDALDVFNNLFSGIKEDHEMHLTRVLFAWGLDLKIWADQKEEDGYSNLVTTVKRCLTEYVNSETFSNDIRERINIDWLDDCNMFMLFVLHDVVTDFISQANLRLSIAHQQQGGGHDKAVASN